MAIPTKDTLLVGYSTNFNDRIVAHPSDYGFSAGQATAYTAVHTPYITAYEAVRDARDAGTRSSPLVATKDLAKANLLRYARELYADLQASLTVPDSRKIEMGVRVRAHPSPQPPPANAPGINVLSTFGNTVRLRLNDPTNESRRGKPVGVVGASVFSFVGPAAPTTQSDWQFEANTTRTILEIVFPGTVPPGARVWFTAYWYNARAQRGPASLAVGINIPGGAAMAA